MIIFPVLALGLALLGIGSRFLIKHDAARRAQVDDRGRHEGRDGLHRQVSVIEGQEFHSFVSVVSDQGTLRADGDAVKITREISKRRHKLAQLRQHIERMLRSATGPYAQPLQEQTMHEGMKKRVWRANHGCRMLRRFYLAAALKRPRSDRPKHDRS